MKKTYSISVEEETMDAIDKTAKSLGLNRSSYLTFLATSIEGLLGSQEKRDEGASGVVDALSRMSSLKVQE